MLPVFRISRLRFGTDGKGITTLVGLFGCPNQCRYCINYSWFKIKPQNLCIHELYNLVAVDDIYFRITGGGITFGGGEPLLWPEQIIAFAQLVNKKWAINIETSLNVPWENVEKLIPYVDAFIVDIKDMNEDIYLAYTGESGAQVRKNIAQLAQLIPQKIVVRIPFIPEFNASEDIYRSRMAIENMGICSIDVFTYRKCSTEWEKQPQNRHKGNNINA